MAKETIYAVVVERQADPASGSWDEISSWECDTEEDARGLFEDLRANILDKMVIEEYRAAPGHPLLDVRVSLEEWTEKEDEEGAVWSKVIDRKGCNAGQAVERLRASRGFKPNEERSKAEFKALRELAGISQAEMAQVLGADIKTVKRWENPDYFPPTDIAWQFVDDFFIDARDEADRMVAEAKAIYEKEGGKEPVQLGYYRTQDQLPADLKDAAFSYESFNAKTRWAAARLDGMGIPYKFVYPDQAEEE